MTMQQYLGLVLVILATPRLAKDEVVMDALVFMVMCFFLLQLAVGLNP